MEHLRDALAPSDGADGTTLHVVNPTSSPKTLPEAKESPPVLPAAQVSHVPFWGKIMGQPGVPLPLFHRTKTKPNGDIEETMWGPAAVQMLRWMVVLILGIVALWKGGSASGVPEMLLKGIGQLR